MQIWSSIQCMRFKILLLISHLFVFQNLIQGQVASENIVHDEDAHATNAVDWIPSLLNATANPLNNFVTFNGRIFSWNLRGENNAIRIVDGIHWHSNIKSWNGDRLITGINNVFKRDEFLFNSVYSKSGFWSFANISLMSSENTQEKKSITLSNSFSVTPQINNLKSVTAIYRTGLLSNKIKLSAAIKIEDAPLNVLPNGYKKAMHIFFSIDKKWNNQTSLGLSVFWNRSDQGRAATGTNEVILLSKQRSYSANWGWYQQKAFFPSTRQTNTPIITLRYQKKWNERNMLSINNGVVFGKEASSNLEWTKAADPRPDYYKYLPSYFIDTALQSQLRNWYLQHPEKLQINFDRLAAINKSSLGGRSFYFVNQENSALLMMHGSVLFSSQLKPNLSFQTGIHYAWDQIHFYNTVKDLLGGQFLYNYNGWMNDDSLALSFQQDVLHPDKKMKQGEKWGPDFLIRSFQFRPWMQVQRLGPIFETSIALGYSIDGLARIGFNQNGLFENSKGSTGFNVFYNTDAKAQILYKLNGRLYFKSILFAKWMAPKYQSVFLDPEINIAASPFVAQEQQYGADFSVLYRAPNLKSSISCYQNMNFNETENRMFYHDAYALFVYGSIGNMHSVNRGIEFVIETSILQNLKLNYAATFVDSYYFQNANYQFVNINNLQLRESGWLQIKDLRSSNSPNLVNAFSLIYQPMYGFTIGLTAIYANERSIAPSLFRRSDWVKIKVDPISWSQIQAIEMLDDNKIINVFLSKFFQTKLINTSKLLRWSMSGGIRNIFNALIPVIAYEQTRFDYLRFNKNKFPPKYLMDAGASFSVRIQLQIQ